MYICLQDENKEFSINQSILIKLPNRADIHSRLPKWYFSVQNLRLMRYDESILFLTFSCVTLFVQPLSEWRNLPNQRINLFLLLSLWSRRNNLLRSEHDVFKLMLNCKMYIYIYMSFVWNISGIFAATNTCSRTLTATTNVKQVASRNYPSNYRFVDTLVQLLSQHVASFWNINNSRKRNASSVYTFKNLPDSKSHMMTINLGTAIDVGTR